MPSLLAAGDDDQPARHARSSASAMRNLVLAAMAAGKHQCGA